MAKAAINKFYKISAKGILAIEDNVVGVENLETGELVNLADLFVDFENKDIAITITYNEDYE